MSLDCFLLGTGGMAPMPDRLLVSLAVRLKGAVYLFDAGEGTQLGWKKLRIGIRGARLIAVSHLHADHCLGIPGIMMLRAQLEQPGPLTILGPPGIERFILEIRAVLDFYINYPVRFVEWKEGAGELAFEDEHARIFWEPMRHTRFCLGYRFEERERPGSFNPEKASRLKVPKGPLWGKLQRGESVALPGGGIVAPAQVMGPARRGRHIAYVVDTRPNKGIYRLCNRVDLAFIEGMFLPEHAKEAGEKGHMTVLEASAIAARAGAAQAVLVHVSPRYKDEDLESLETEAHKRFDRACVGRDGQVFSIPYAD